MVDRGGKDIGGGIGALGGKAAARFRSDIDDKAFAALRLREGRQRNEACRVKPPAPLRRHKIERMGGQRLIGRSAGVGVMRAFAGVVIILDLRQTLACGFFGERIEDERGAGAIVEQRVELFVKKRQPMFEALIAAAFADGFIEGIAARLRAKMRHIGLPEPSDRRALELHLAHRHEIERPELSGRALRVWDRKP